MSELSELFARDPLHLSDADIDTIVARHRESQAQYELGAVVAPKAPKPKKPSAAAVMLKELGLD